LLESKVSQ